MAKAKTRPKEEAEGRGRADSVKPPPDLPEASPFERMTELARRLFGVPKAEIAAPKRPPKRKHG